MTDRVRRRVGSIGLLLGFAALVFICMLTALHAVGTDDALYFREQMAAGVLPEAGVSEQTLRELDAALADYLAGDAHALEQPGTDDATGLRAEVFGELRPAFNDRETAHLADCFALFALLRKVRSRLYAWAVLLIAGGAYLLRDRRRIRRIAWLSAPVILAPLAAFAVWAAADFDGAFTFFHKALFANDLWLLDPRTDLLIRICPQSMFMHMGARIALWSAAALAGIPALATLIAAVWPKRKEDDTWNNRDMRRASAQKRMTFGQRGGR